MAEALGNEYPSGYDEDFLDTVEHDFICLICQLPLREPLQTKCGHRFCKGCLEECFRRLEINDQPSACPVDREVLDKDKPDVFPDKATERKILSFAIKCPCGDCEWTGELRNKETHLKACLFKVITCPNEHCHETMQRREVIRHKTITCLWRITECEHCNEPHPACCMQDHIERCLKYPVTCPNGCGLSIQRELIPNHTKDDCPHAMIFCPYTEMGCETKVQRKQVETHLQTAVTVHLDLACLRLKETQNLTRQLMDKVSTLQNLLLEKVLKDEYKMIERENGTCFWKIHDFDKVFKQAKAGNKERVECVIPHTQTYGYNLKIRIYPNGRAFDKNTHLSAFIVVMKGEDDPVCPFSKKVRLTLIDQQDGEDKRENVSKLVNLYRFPDYSCRLKGKENEEFGYNQFISHKKLKSRKYIVDDNLFLQVKIQENI